MDDNNLNHLIAVNVLVPRLSVCEAERDVAQASCEAAWRRVHRLQEAIQLHKREIMGDEPDGADERLWSALSGVIPAPPDGMTLLDQTRLLLVGEKEHAIHWREYAAQVQDDRHRLAEALRWLLTSATSGPLRTAGPAQFYDAQVGLHAVEKARAALALYQDVGQDAEEQERRYERMMRERGFVSAADLCDPDWDEPSDDDSEATR